MKCFPQGITDGAAEAAPFPCISIYVIEPPTEVVPFPNPFESEFWPRRLRIDFFPNAGAVSFA
jgi:hypothetical protein